MLEQESNSSLAEANSTTQLQARVASPILGYDLWSLLKTYRDCEM